MPVSGEYIPHSPPSAWFSAAEEEPSARMGPLKDKTSGWITTGVASEAEQSRRPLGASFSISSALMSQRTIRQQMRSARSFLAAMRAER